MGPTPSALGPLLTDRRWRGRCTVSKLSGRVVPCGPQRPLNRAWWHLDQEHSSCDQLPRRSLVLRSVGSGWHPAQHLLLCSGNPTENQGAQEFLEFVRSRSGIWLPLTGFVWEPKVCPVSLCDLASQKQRSQSLSRSNFLPKLPNQHVGSWPGRPLHPKRQGHRQG